MPSFFMRNPPYGNLLSLGFPGLGLAISLLMTFWMVQLIISLPRTRQSCNPIHLTSNLSPVAIILGYKGVNSKGRIYPQGPLILLIYDQLPNIKVRPRRGDIWQTPWMQKGQTYFLIKATQSSPFISHIDFFSPNRMAIVKDELAGNITTRNLRSDERCGLREMGKKVHLLHLFALAEKVRTYECSRPGDNEKKHTMKRRLSDGKDTDTHGPERERGASQSRPGKHEK